MSHSTRDGVFDKNRILGFQHVHFNLQKTQTVALRSLKRSSNDYPGHTFWELGKCEII